MYYCVYSKFSCILLTLPVRYLLYNLLNVVSSSRKSGSRKSKRDHSSHTLFYKGVPERAILRSHLSLFTVYAVTDFEFLIL